jgi:5-methylcytosine-specific restriction protein B
MIEKFKQLLDTYLVLLKNEKYNNEIYKWDAIDHFQKHWQADTDDFYIMFKEAFKKKDNLLFLNSYGFLDKLGKLFPEKLRALMLALYDESIPLNERFKTHQKKSKEYLIELKLKLDRKNLNHQQDERTISFLLVFRYPEKYFLYMDTVYKAYCNEIGVKAKNAGDKFYHFTELGNNVLPIIEQNEQLQNAVKSFLKGNYSFDSNKLIFQDILFRTLLLEVKNGDVKGFLGKLAYDIREELTVMNHPLAQHVWQENDSATYRQISILPDEDIVSIQDIHYEILLYANKISAEIHPEGKRPFKLKMKPLVENLTSDDYKLVVWSHPVKEHEYEKGEFHKIVPNELVDFKMDESYYPTLKENLKNQFIKLYDDYNDRFVTFFKDGNNNTMEAKAPKSKASNKNMEPTNLILFGPPGTGKTFNTINKAIELINPHFDLNQEREKVKAEFDRLKSDGKIVFTTFHQSMSYEDFVEGIKPVLSDENDNSLKYHLASGILKVLVERINEAIVFETSEHNELILSKDKFSNPINKVSLGRTGTPEEDMIYNYCMKNNCIAISYGDDIDFKDVKNRSDIRKKYKEHELEYGVASDFAISAIERLVLWMKEGQLVFVSDGLKMIKAIGEVSGKYFCNPNAEIPYVQFREVNWIYKDLELPIFEIYGKVFSQQTIYQIDGKQIDQSFFSKEGKHLSNEKSNYVLIIDEINRGNVSQILGELITLIEPDKRQGMPEALELTLPYSKEKFSVPSNLHIIGTMNTADRSVEALDTALRRRFEFKEMVPRPELVSPARMIWNLFWKYEDVKWENAEYKNKEAALLELLKPQDFHNKKKIIWDKWDDIQLEKQIADLEQLIYSGINLQTLLIIINARIEKLLDKDHKIGHSYFMSVYSLEDLKAVFRNSVIPLLEEYFFGDYGKIGLVLGSSFVEKLAEATFSFAKFNDYDQSIQNDLKDRVIYKIRDEQHWNFSDI